MAVDYVVSLTTGDIYATYDLYFDAVGLSNVCSFTTGGTATNVSYNELVSGVSVVVPDYASQIIVKSNGTCQNFLYLQITPVVVVAPPTDLCLRYKVNEQNGVLSYNWTFSPNGTLNGKNKWTYTNPTTGLVYNISWNLTAGQWEMVYNSNVVFILRSTSLSPEGTWVSTNTNYFDISTTSGTCPATSDVIITKVETVNTQCKGVRPCTGKVIITATGGVPPYEYAVSAVPGNPSSINWQSSNIIQGLCESTVNVVVRDTVGTVSQSSSASISYNQIPATYNLILEQVSFAQTINTNQPQRRVAENSVYRLKTDIPLPAGISLNLSMSTTDQLTIFEPVGNYNVTKGHTITKNGILLTPTPFPIQTTTTGRPNCNNLNQSFTSATDSYNFTYVEGDIIEISASADLSCELLTSNGCTTQIFHYLDFGANGVALGCQCCTIGEIDSAIILDFTT